MKFTTVLFAGLAAFSQAKAEPQPDIFDDVETFINGIETKWDDVSSLANDIKTRIEAATSDPEGAYSDAIASITAAAGDALASLSRVAATASGSNLAEATEAIARYSSEINEVVAEASQAVDDVIGDDDDNKGAIPTAAVALAGIIGGAALFANL